jgi:uncharacterized protein YecE (DUF72 family)
VIRVGPAGWSYPDWDGRVYPPHRSSGFHALSFLAPFVDCIEINSSFYALPRAEHAANWTRLVAAWPPFRFVAKLHRSFTHEEEPADPEVWDRAARSFLDGISPLERARKLACILVQFPTSFLFGAAQVRRLGRLHSLLAGRALVLEVRHHSWFSPPALDTIRGLAYSLAWIDLPAAWNHPPDWHAPTGPVGYLRLHGRNSSTWFASEATRDDRYDYLYGRDELRALADKARRIESETDETYVITNNHFEGKAVANALEISALLRGAPVPAPAELVRAFPHLADSVRVEGQGELF